MTDEQFSVHCSPFGFGWKCRVFVGSVEEGVEHLVLVSGVELGRYAPGAAEPRPLVEESFRFLLEREPPSAILRKFALSEIERYFPEYRAEIAERLA